MFSILSGTNSFVANVATSNQLLKSNPSNAVSGNPSYTGNYVTRVCEQDAGVVTGVVKQLQPDVSGYYRKRVGKSSIIHYTKFGSKNISSSDLATGSTLSYTDKWSTLNTTVSTSSYNGSIILNSGGAILGSGNGACLSSYQSFSFQPAIPIELEMIAKYVSNKTNTVCETIIGFALYSVGIVSTSANVVSGIYFKYTQGGTLYGCITCNGTDYMTPVLLTPEMYINHTYKIVISNGIIEFIIDGVYQSSISSPFIYQLVSTPISFRAISIVTSSYVTTLEIISVIVSITDINTYKPWPHIMTTINNRISTFPNCTIGVIATSTPNGSTSIYTNSMVLSPFSIAESTTNTQRYGGQYSILPSQTISTVQGGIIFAVSNLCGAFLQPDGITNKNFILMGLNIQGCITTVLSNPVTYIYYLSYGSTGSFNLQTTNNNGSVKGYRQIPIGVDTAFTNLTVGTLGIEFKIVFNPPIILNIEEYIAVAAKNINTATTSGVITYLIAFDGYWE
jgi:hypothetical protein